MPESADVWERLLTRLSGRDGRGPWAARWAPARPGGGDARPGRGGARPEGARPDDEARPGAPDDLTDSERGLWDAYPTGGRVVLGTDPPAGPEPGRVVRAEVLSVLCLGGCPDRPGHVPAIRLTGAYITGELNVTGGTVGCELRFERCRFERPPNFSNAQTRQIRLSECALPGFDGGGLRAEGYLSLSGSTIEGQLRLPRAQLSGGFRMNGTKVTAPDPHQWAVYTGGLVVDVGTFVRDAEIVGGLRFVGARMNGGLFMQGTVLSNPGRLAMDAENMIVQDAMECTDGFRADGTVRLRGIQVHGALSFSGAILSAPGRHALHASNAQISELILAPSEPVVGTVSLAFSRIGLIADNPRTWPDVLLLNGLVYESLRGAPPAERLRWVSREPDRFRPEVYEQLAEYYRRSGHDDLAMQAQLAKQRARRRTLSVGGRVAGLLLDWTVGYGYRPWRAALWFAVLTTVGTLVFSAEQPRTLRPPEERPHFNAFSYTMDLLVPIGTFGQRDAWDPTGWTQWLAYVLIASGWILATALIAGATRVLRPR